MSIVIGKFYRVNITEADTSHLVLVMDFTTKLEMKNTLSKIRNTTSNELYRIYEISFVLNTTTHIISPQTTELTEL